MLVEELDGGDNHFEVQIEHCGLSHVLPFAFHLFYSLTLDVFIALTGGQFFQNCQAQGQGQGQSQSQSQKSKVKTRP